VLPKVDIGAGHVSSICNRFCGRELSANGNIMLAVADRLTRDLPHGHVVPMSPSLDERAFAKIVS